MQPCPRQSQEAVMSSQRAHQSHWRQDGTCSYCGSIAADALFQAIADGCEIGPTDKDYKIYVDLREPNPDELRVVSAVKFDMTEEQRVERGWLPADPAILARDGWRSEGYRWMQLQPRGPIKHAKFYFQHLTIDERKRFVELMNAKAITFGHPGHFYVRPFFVVVEAPKVVANAGQ